LGELLDDIINPVVTAVDAKMVFQATIGDGGDEGVAPMSIGTQSGA
jgi:hypothetical protein